MFRNERTNYRVNDPGNPDNPSQEQRLDGRARVDGVMLGIGGLLREDWGVFANYSYLDSEVLQGASDFVSSTGPGLHQRRSAAQRAEECTSACGRSTICRGALQLGYGVTYQDEVYVGQHSATNLDGPLPTAAELRGASRDDCATA